jgi:hypothetical protein
MKALRLFILVPVFMLISSGVKDNTAHQKTKGCVWVFTTTYDDVRIKVSEGNDNDCSKNNIKGPFHIKKGKDFKISGTAKICYQREKHVGKDKDEWGPWMKVTSKFDDGREEKVTIH